MNGIGAPNSALGAFHIRSALTRPRQSWALRYRNHNIPMKTNHLSESAPISRAELSEFKVQGSKFNVQSSPFSEFADRLVTLCDGRPGLRGGLHAEVREPSPTLDSGPGTQDSGPRTQDSSPSSSRP